MPVGIRPRGLPNSPEVKSLYVNIQKLYYGQNFSCVNSGLLNRFFNVCVLKTIFFLDEQNNISA